MSMAGALIRRQGLAKRPALQLLRSASASSSSSASAQALARDREDLLRKKDTAAAAAKPEVVYQGVMASTLRRVKILSFSSFAFSSLGAPVLAFHTYPDVSVVAKSAIASIMIMISALTTAGLHWFAGPYVRKLTWRPGSREIQLETLNMLARPVRWRIPLSDVRPADTNKPLATFYAKGNHFYIDEDNFPSSELLKKLVKK